jgi:hypothetical protein
MRQNGAAIASRMSAGGSASADECGNAEETLPAPVEHLMNSVQ